MFPVYTQKLINMIQSHFYLENDAVQRDVVFKEQLGNGISNNTMGKKNSHLQYFFSKN
jgi:hypothetical protein